MAVGGSIRVPTRLGRIALLLRICGFREALRGTAGAHLDPTATAAPSEFRTRSQNRSESLRIAQGSAAFAILFLTLPHPTMKLVEAALAVDAVALPAHWVYDVQAIKDKGG